MTHDDLVQRAARWLRTKRGCGVVLTEHRSAWPETPDAIGWRYGFSTLVECKVSRSDFFADRKKSSRLPGAERPAFQCFYLTPPGLVAESDLPDGWGLLWAHPRKVEVVREVKPVSDDRTNIRHELYMLLSEVRRYHAQGITYRKVDDLLRSESSVGVTEGA